MKIYTITFCNTTNVGAALQEYALQKYLQLKGHEVTVVNYIPKVMADNQSVLYTFKDTKNIGAFIKALILLPIKINRKIKYQIFSYRFINLSKLCKDENDIEKLIQPDIYIVGSDQVWNDELVNWEPGFFLQIKTSARKVSYAASAGKDKLSADYLKNLSARIKDFSGISVREEVLQKALAETGIENVRQVVDPVFLLPKETYISILKKPKIRNYILVYEAEINENCILTAQKLEEKHGLKIVQINRINNRYHVDRVYPCVSPEEFLGLVQYADYIITNSFHAVAVSLIFEKQFWAISLK